MANDVTWFIVEQWSDEEGQWLEQSRTITQMSATRSMLECNLDRRLRVVRSDTGQVVDKWPVR